MRADIECFEECMTAVESLDGCEVIMEVLQKYCLKKAVRYL